MNKKAIFLDRDGVINEDFGYVSKIKDFHFIDGVFDALRGFLELGYELFIVTNQSGIGRGYYTLEDFEKLNNYMLEIFKKEGIEIKKVYFCPHSPEDNCDCRKPHPGMILKALDEFQINPKLSVMIGDKASDIEAGENAKIAKTYLISQNFPNLLSVFYDLKTQISNK